MSNFTNSKYVHFQKNFLHIKTSFFLTEIQNLAFKFVFPSEDLKMLEITRIIMLNVF